MTESLTMIRVGIQIVPGLLDGIKSIIQNKLKMIQIFWLIGGLKMNLISSLKIGVITSLVSIIYFVYFFKTFIRDLREFF